MKSFERAFPWMVAGLAGLVVVTMVLSLAFGRGDRPDEMHLNKLGQIPVVHNGRVMPLDTMARQTLLQINSRSTFRDENNKRQPALRWMLDAMTVGAYGNDAVKEHRVIRIENLDVLAMFGLKARPGSYRYSLKEITEPRMKDFYQAATALRQSMRSRQITREELSATDSKILELESKFITFNNVARWRKPLIVPPEAGYKDWVSLIDIEAEIHQNGNANLALASEGQKLQRTFKHILAAYAKNNVSEFNRYVDEYHDRIGSVIPQAASRADFEDFYTRLQPFMICLISYLIVFIMACCSWLGWMGPLNRAAFWLGVVTFVVHMFALFARMYLLDRPFVFVTNLYSSAIFISWIGVYLGLFLEAVYRNGLGNAVAGLIGFSTLIVGHNLASGGETLEPMQAVLDTNFWLATHVTTVTIGYAATFVAGGLGIFYILRGILAQTSNRLFFADLGRMIYGIVCFATLFSFVGTVLGGIWADQSWGRFWGWDPKENGALIIVVWNALILHARWGGVVKHRGVATLAVGGNIITIWSWFGVNMLGVGLHSYGFIPGAVIAIAIIVALHKIVIVLGVLLPFINPPVFGAKRKANGTTTESSESSENGTVPPVAKELGKNKRSKSIMTMPKK